MQKRTKFIIGVSLVVSAITTMFTFIALCAKKKSIWAAFAAIAAAEGVTGLLLIDSEPIKKIKLKKCRKADDNADGELVEDTDEFFSEDAEEDAASADAEAETDEETCIHAGIPRDEEASEEDFL